MTNQNMKIDHILMRVENLKIARSEFENLGFKVYYGNNNKNCHHGMIFFSDGSFLELIDQTKFPGLFKFLARINVLKHFGIIFERFSKYCISKDRFLDFAVQPDNMEEFYNESKGKSPSKLMKMKRINHKGQELKWKLFSFNQIRLPFIMSKYTPNGVPDEKASIHKNGIIGIKGIEIYSENPKTLMTDFDNDLGIGFFNNIAKVGSSEISIIESSQYKISSLILISDHLDNDIARKIEKYHIKITYKSNDS